MGRQPKDKPNLFQYRDYRKYLGDFYKTAKASRAGFSLREFSKKGGFGSSNLFKLVMDGDRNLSEKSIRKFSTALNHTKQEAEFFLHLVLFTQATNHDEKNTHYKKMIQSQKLSNLKPIENNQYEYYSTWYHSVVRELIVLPEFNNDVKKLTDQIVPKISESQIQKSIELLQNLGFITQNEVGKWLQTNSVVTTGAESRSVVLMNYHKNVLDLVKNQLDKIPPESRDISALTLGVDESTIDLIKEKIREFRNEILQLVSNQNNSKHVALLTLQFLPVTKCWSEAKS